MFGPQAGWMPLGLHITLVGCQVRTGMDRAWMSDGVMDVSMLHVKMLMTGELFCLHSDVTTLHALFGGQS